MFRLLPYVIICLFLMAFSKFLSIFENMPDIFSVTEIVAQNTNTMQDADTASTDTIRSATTDATPLQPAAQQQPTETLLTNTGEEPSQSVYDPMLYNVLDKPSFSQSEIEVLLALSKRREELDQREKTIQIKKEALKAIEVNIDNKLKQLQALQVAVDKILKEYEEKEDAKIAGLVKVYENMKPKDAAVIFEKLQMSILLDVAENMKEAKLALILAQMNPIKAKELTVEMATRRKLNLNTLAN